MTGPTREEVALIEELRLIGCHENGDARCTCGIGNDAADTITALRDRAEAAEAEIERLTKERDALATASWIAGRDAAADRVERAGHSLSVELRHIAPPTDATAALQAVKDAEYARGLSDGKKDASNA